MRHSPARIREGETLSTVTLDQAERIMDAVLARGRELDSRPLAVVVTDIGAHVIAFKKEDGSAMMRFEMALGKAYAALALGRSSSLVRQRAEERPLFMSYLTRAADGRIFAEGGGMLIRDDRCELIGAVGVTGDTETRDEELAAHGIRSAGLKTDADCAQLGKRVRLTNK